MPDKNKKETSKFLIIYGVIIIAALVLIMFIIPDEAFLGNYKDVELPLPNKEEKREFVDYKTQLDNLLTKDYDYEYVLLDSMGKKTYQYNCKGKVTKELESGTCTEPSSFSYTETTKAESFKISTKYLDIKEIYALIENIEPEETKYTSYREYNYKTMIEDLETEIIVHTDLDNITRIDISNAYMTYLLKYSNIV